jgi:hypothetical protein
MEDGGDTERGSAPRRGSRAEKSLGLLSSKFMELYASSSAGESQISLDHAAASLGVERRRMYDVVGVRLAATRDALLARVRPPVRSRAPHARRQILEACEVVVRRGKNAYT